MTIWILAIVLLAGLAAAGYSQGAIKVGFSLVGIFAGIVLAIPLSPAVEFVLPIFGVSTPWTKAIIGPTVALLLVGAVFKVAALFVSRKVDYHFKYRASDAVRALWERMNRRLGLCLGMVNGWIYFLLICMLASVLGYFTTQMNAGENSAFALRAFTKMAEDLKSTHMDKAVVGLTPVQALTEKRYYEISDFMGFLANNRSVIGRFRTYPPFAVMAKKPTFQPLAEDKDFVRLVETEQDPMVLLNHARVQEILTNSDAMTEVLSIDLKDLTTYLTTGKSDKFAQERILGTWVYNFPSSFVLARKEGADLLTSQIMKVRKELEGRFAGALFVTSMDNRAAVQLPTALEGTPCPGVSNATLRTSYMGSWKHTGDSYQLTLAPSSKSSYHPPGTPPSVVNTSQATIEKQPEVEQISFKLSGQPVVFDKIPE